MNIIYLRAVLSDVTTGVQPHALAKCRRAC